MLGEYPVLEGGVIKLIHNSVLEIDNQACDFSGNLRNSCHLVAARINENMFFMIKSHIFYPY